MDKKNTIITVLLISFFLVGNALAADESTGGSLSIQPNKFVSKNIWDDVKPVLPIFGLIFSFLIVAYLATAFGSPIANAIKINVGPIINNHNLRKDGQHGIIHSVGGLLLLVVGFMLIVMLWNSYGPGSW